MMTRRSTTLILFLLLLTGGGLSAQKQEATAIDSLLAGLAAANEAGAQADLLNKIGATYMKSSRLDSALYYYDQAQEVSEKNGYKFGLASAQNDIGYVNYLSGKYLESLPHFRSAIRIWEETGHSEKAADAGYNMGIVFLSLSKYEESLGHIRQSLPVFEKAGDKRKMSSAYQVLANVYYAQGDYPKALENYHVSLKLAELIGFKQVMAYNYGGIGIIQMQQKAYERSLTNFMQMKDVSKEIGDKQGEMRAYLNTSLVYKALKDYPKALENQKNALQLAKEIGNNHLIAAVGSALGRIYEEQGNYQDALEVYINSVEKLKGIGDKRMLAGFNYYTGNMHNKLNQPQEAKERLLQSLALGREIGSLELLKDSYEGLSDAEAMLGNHKEAYQNYKNYVVYKDSLYNEENTKKFTRLEVQYDYEKKQDSLKFVSEQEQLALQKEMQLAALRHDYEKKQALARSDEERRQLLQQEEMKRQKIQNDYAVSQAESRRKEAEIQLELEREKGVRNVSLAGLALVAGLGGLLLYQNQQRKRHNRKLLQLNAELDEANRIKTRFFGILNHDLRSPVSNLIHFLHLKKENPEMLDGHVGNRLEEKTVKGAENLLATMEDLLLWSKGQMEYFEPQLQPLPIDKLFEATRQYFSGEEKIKLVFKNPEELQVVSDENYLKTILRNLTSNAVKALQDTNDPTITWDAQKENGQVILSISDNGPGADQPAFRALYDDTEVVGSKNGLGMHLIRDLAKPIGCTVSVASTAGAGTTITLRM